MIHNDLTFFTNEPERDLYSRFSKILKSNTQDVYKRQVLDMIEDIQSIF